MGKKKKNKYTNTADDFDFSDFNTEDNIFSSSEHDLSQPNCMGGGFGGMGNTDMNFGYIGGHFNGFGGFNSFNQSNPFDTLHKDTGYVNKIFYFKVDKKTYKELKKRLDNNLCCIGNLLNMGDNSEGLWVTEDSNDCKYSIKINVTYKEYELMNLAEGKELEAYIKEMDLFNIKHNTTLELVDGIMVISNKRPKLFKMDRTVGTKILIRDYSIINYLEI